MTRRPTRRRGNVIILVAAAALVFLGLLALVIDSGSWYGTRVRVQAVLDLAGEAALARVGAEPRLDVARQRALRIVKRTLIANDVATGGLTLKLRNEGKKRILDLRVEGPLGRHFSRGPSAFVTLVVVSRVERGPEGALRLLP